MRGEPNCSRRLTMETNPANPICPTCGGCDARRMGPSEWWCPKDGAFNPAADDAKIEAAVEAVERVKAKRGKGRAKAEAKDLIRDAVRDALGPAVTDALGPLVVELRRRPSAPSKPPSGQAATAMSPALEELFRAVTEFLRRRREASETAAAICRPLEKKFEEAADRWIALHLASLPGARALDHIVTQWSWEAGQPVVHVEPYDARGRVILALRGAAVSLQLRDVA
jgi:hypothetical protein